MTAGARRDAIVTMLATSQVVVALLAAAFHLGVRVELLREIGAPRDAATAIALSGWLQPAASGGALVVAAVSLAAPMRRSLRTRVLGTALVVSGFALVFAGLAAIRALLKG